MISQAWLDAKSLDREFADRFGKATVCRKLKGLARKPPDTQLMFWPGRPYLFARYFMSW